MSLLIAKVVSHLFCFGDANEFTICLDECAHSGEAALADPGGQLPFYIFLAFLPLEPLLFPPVSAFAWRLSGYEDARMTEVSTTPLQLL